MCSSFAQKRSYFFYHAEHISSIVGIARAVNKNIKRCTSLIKLAFFIVFQNLILNCGLSERTLSIPSQVDFLTPLTRWQYEVYVKGGEGDKMN